MITRVPRVSATDYPPGWTCEIVLARLDRYVVGALPRSELLAIAEHIEACFLCAQHIRLALSDPT